MIPRKMFVKVLLVVEGEVEGASDVRNRNIYMTRNSSTVSLGVLNDRGEVYMLT